MKWLIIVMVLMSPHLSTADEHRSHPRKINLAPVKGVPATPAPEATVGEEGFQGGSAADVLEGRVAAPSPTPETTVEIKAEVKTGSSLYVDPECNAPLIPAVSPEERQSNARIVQRCQQRAEQRRRTQGSSLKK